MTLAPPNSQVATIASFGRRRRPNAAPVQLPANAMRGVSTCLLESRGGSPRQRGPRIPDGHDTARLPRVKQEIGSRHVSSKGSRAAGVSSSPVGGDKTRAVDNRNTSSQACGRRSRQAVQGEVSSQLSPTETSTTIGTLRSRAVSISVRASVTRSATAAAGHSNTSSS